MQYRRLSARVIAVIGSTDSLFVDGLHHQESTSAIYVWGKFYNNLFFQNQSLFNSDQAHFFLEFSKTGDLRHAYLFENKNETATFKVNINGNGLPVVATEVIGRNSTALWFNGSAVSLRYARWGGIALFELENGNLKNIGEIPQSQGVADLKLLGIAASPEGDYVSVAWEHPRDSRHAKLNNSYLSYPYAMIQEPHVVVATLTRLGRAQYAKAFVVDELYPEQFTMTYSEKDYFHELAIGMTFGGALDFGSSLLNKQSAGGKDLVLMKIGGSGTYNWVHQYGTSQDENVSQLLYDHGVLFFGGEFQGGLDYRQIGNYNFFDLANADQRAYISYIYDEDHASDAALQEVGQQPSITRARKMVDPQTIEKELEAYEPLSVFPNPFKRNLTVQIGIPGDYQIRIVDALGKTIHEVPVIRQSNFTIDLRDAPSGLLMVHLMDAAGQVVEAKMVFHAN